MVFKSFKKGRSVKNKEVGNGSVTTSATYGRIILSDNVIKLLQLTEGDKIKIVYTDDIKDLNHKFVIFKANNDEDALVLKFQFSRKNIRNGAVVFNTIAWINLLEITNVHAIYENYNEGVLAGLIKLTKKVKLFTPNYLVKWFIGDKVKIDISDKVKIDGYWLTTPKTILPVIREINDFRDEKDGIPNRIKDALYNSVDSDASDYKEDEYEDDEDGDFEDFDIPELI